MKLTVHPLTPVHWPAFQDLFEDSAVCRHCWCMAWRIGPRYRGRPAEVNRSDFHDIVRRGPPPGLLAFEGDLAVGWCQLTPRDDLPAFDRQWRLRRIDDAPVWSLSCFYVRKRFRRRGITAVLIRAALKAARRANAPALEGYPLDRDRTTSATSTGVLTTFQRAGFEEVARRVSPRPIMRHDLEGLG